MRDLRFLRTLACSSSSSILEQMEGLLVFFKISFNTILICKPFPSIFPYSYPPYCSSYFFQNNCLISLQGVPRSSGQEPENDMHLFLFSTVLGAIAYWLFGYAFAFGADGNSFIGYKYFALADLPADKYSHWFFHYVFAATAATIVSGAMAERTKFKAYLAYSVFLTGEWQLSLSFSDKQMHSN